MCEASELNKLITTVTAQCALEAMRTTVGDDVFITGSACFAAVDAIVARGQFETKKRVFKNCKIVYVKVRSCRGGERTVAVKVFKNLMLHVTGCHSIEMIRTVCSRVAQKLSDELGSCLRCGDPKVTMSNYVYSLPGNVNLLKLTRHFAGRNYLSIFDPARYAGANIKIPLDDHKHASLMVFESGRAIISVPHVQDRDVALKSIITCVETEVVANWDLLITHTAVTIAHKCDVVMSPDTVHVVSAGPLSDCHRPDVVRCFPAGDVMILLNPPVAGRC